MIQNEWVDVCIRTTVDAGELLGLLDDPAVQGAWEDAGNVHVYWPEAQWNGDRLASMRRLLGMLDDGVEPSIEVNRVPYQDWNEQWARSVKPLRIGRLVIRPSWEPALLSPDDVEIVLDPKQAFGTGHHATTRMLLEWLQEHIHGGETLLDVGSGSAILSIAAVKLGAATAVAVECDAVAVECAKESVTQNRLEGSVELVCGTLADVVGRTRHVDVVLANIDRPTLLSMAHDLAVYGDGAAGHAAARLVLSGILLEQKAEIVERFAALGLACVTSREQEGWLALELIRPEPCEGVE
jgi:ribosomal protein L11 methyltransferase